MMNSSTNTNLHLAIGGLLAGVVWGLDYFGGIKVPGEVAMGVGTAVETFLLLLLPPDLMKQAKSE